jgi:exopolysaccharide biosynthesis polyprenyl glycosylphosphotransferase
MTAAVDDVYTGRVTVPSRHDIHRNIRVVLRFTAVADTLIIGLSVLVAWQLRSLCDQWGLGPLSADSLSVRAVPLLIVGWLLVLLAGGGYSARNFGTGPEEFRTVGRASFITAGVVGLACYLFNQPLSRGFVVLAFVIGTPLLFGGRYAIRQSAHTLRRDGRLMHRVIAVGGPSGISEVVDSLRRSPHVGFQVVGACLPDTIAVEPDRFPVPIIGRVADTRALCEANGADTVLVARGGYASAKELRRIAWDLEGSSIDLVVVPSLTDVAGPRIHMRPVAGLPLLHVEQPQAGKAGGWSKRVFDIVVASMLLFVLAPVLLAVALVVKMHDGGPVFFRQTRVGRSGQSFPMMKFRSMAPDAEARLASLSDLNESDGLLFKIRDDPRVTPVGRFIRRYSIDELPQLLNVIRGDMSLVGPRPPLLTEVDQYADDVRRRLLVRPGLTGLWQVSGRSSLSWDEAVRLDLFYVDNWTMTSDLVIMAKTVRAVLQTTGAY